MGYACPCLWVSMGACGVCACGCVCSMCVCVCAAREYRVFGTLGGEQIFDGFGNCALSITRDSPSNIIKRQSLARVDGRCCDTHAHTRTQPILHAHRVAIVSGQHVRITSFSINEFSVETHLFLRSDVGAPSSLSFSGGFFSPDRIIRRQNSAFREIAAAVAGTIFKVRAAQRFYYSLFSPYYTRVV